MRRLRDITPRIIPDFMWDDQTPVKAYRNNLEAWCAKIEKLLSSRHYDSIHVDHIHNFLALNFENTKRVCTKLQTRGIIGEYNQINKRYKVLHHQ